MLETEKNREIDSLLLSDKKEKTSTSKVTVLFILEQKFRQIKKFEPNLEK